MAIPFLNNIIIDDAGHIQFKTAAGANAGKIDQDGNNLVLTNAVGDILLGDGSSDVFIGDGTNNVDIVFEQSGSIKGDGSAVTLTLGGANTTLNLENPNINGTLSLSGATTISNKLTFTTTNGFILFDYEPSGDTGEYTTEVPLIKVDRSGEESTILARISEYRGIALGIDDTTWIRAGDTSSVIRSNVNLANEVVLMSAEQGFHAYAFPNNDTTWSNRNEFRFYGGGSTASDNGLYIGDGGNTQFIDLSRNLKNIGNITLTGDISTPGQINLPGDGTTSSFETLIYAHGSRAKLMKQGNAVLWQVAQGGNQFEITDAANGNSSKGNVLLRTSGQDADDNKLILVPDGGTATFGGHIILNSAKYLEFSGQGKLINMDVAAWSNATEHNLLYAGWVSSTGDYLSFKVPGNSTSNHGNLIISDNLLSYGRMDATDSAAATDSATNPHGDDQGAAFLVTNTGNATFAGTITGTTLTGTSLDINGNADISGSLTITGAILNNVENASLDIYGGNDTTNDAHIKLHGNANNYGSMELNYGYDATNSYFKVKQGSTENFVLQGGNATFGGSISVSGTATINGPILTFEGTSDQTNSADSTTVPSTTTEEYQRISYPTSYTDGRYTHEWAKIDRGGNLPLYLRQSKGTANSFTNLARFGDHTNSIHEFEVFGSIKATHFYGDGSNLSNVTADDPTNMVTTNTSQTITGQKTFQGNVILDDGSGDTPILKWINGNDNTWNQYVDSNGDMILTRAGSGGAEFQFHGHATDYTNAELYVGGGIVTATKIGQWNTAYGWGNHASAGYAPIASPTFTGTPAAPTASAGTNTTQLATTAFVSTAVSNLVDSAPGTLNTLNELAAALGDDANFSTTVTNSIATKLPLSGGTMTGDIDMNDEMLTYHNGNPELPQFRGKRSSTRLNDRDWNTEGGWSYTTFENNTTDRPSDGLHNGNGLLTFNTHSGDSTNNYMHQIAMTTNTNKLWHRRRSGASWGSWEEIKKGDITFASLTSKPTTLSGYGITDAYTKTESDGKYLLNTTDTLSGNLTVTGDLTVQGVNYGLYHAENASSTESGSSSNYYHDPYGGGRHLAMFLKNARADIIRYSAIADFQYWNGSSWVTDNNQLDNVKKLLDGRQDTSWYFGSTYYKFRFSIKPSTAWPTTAKVGTQTSWTGSTYPGHRMIVEEYDGSAWGTRVTAKFGGSSTTVETTDNNCDNWGWNFTSTNRLHTGNGNSSSYNSGYNTRITIDFYGWSPSNASYTTVPMQNIFITSNFSGLENTDYTNLLDYDRNITTAGAINLGHASDTTIARSAAGKVTIEGNEIYHEGHKPTLAELGAQASGNYITGTGSLSAQDLTDIGNLSGTNTGDQDLSGFVTKASAQTISGAKTFTSGTIMGELVTTNHIYGRSVNQEYSLLYRFGGLFLTWDSDSYGTNFNHSITSTDNGSYSDSITINSYDKVRINIDSNNNDSASTFSIGKHGTGTSGTLLTLEEDGDLTITGTFDASGYNNSNWDTAYGWGNHASAGYLTSSSTQSKYLRSDADDNGTGIIKLTQNNSTTPYPLIVQNLSNANGVGIEFDDNLNGTQRGYITHFHSDSKSYGSGASIILGTTESTLTVLADGKLMYKEGIYSKPSSGTGAGSRKDLQWDTAYSWGNHASAGYLTSSGTIAHANNLNSTDDRDMAPEDLSYSDDLRIFFSAKEGLEDGSSTGSNWQDVLVLNSYYDSSGGNANVLAFDKSEKKIYHYQASLSASNWGTAKELAYTDHNHDDRYYTESESNARFLRGNANDTATGVLTFNGKTIHNDGVAIGDTADTTLTRHSSGHLQLPSSVRIFSDNYHPNADGLTTSRTFTIGSTGKTFDGTGNVSWSLSEIGAAAENQTISIGAAGDLNSASWAANTSLGGLYLKTQDGITAGEYTNADVTVNSKGIITSISNGSSGTSVTYTSSGNRYGVTPFVASDGVMEVGRYIDFHTSDGSTSDYAHRLTVNGSTLNFSAGIAGSSASFSSTVDMNATARFNFTSGSKGSQFETATTAVQTFRCDSDRYRIYMGSERFTVTDTGRVGINDSTPDYTLDVSGNVSGISIYASHDIAAYSDKRVKKDIETIEDALQKVNKLRGVTFKRKDGLSDKVHMGVIAQEVQEVIPEVVSAKESDGHLSVSYGNMVGVLIEAVKELTKEVEELKKCKCENCNCK